MQIESVRARRVGQFLFAEVASSAGLVGYGESGAWGHLEASEAAIKKFAEYLVGKDPRRTELHWNVMHRFSHYNGGAIGGAISAIDMALWDLKGKQLGVPLYELFGGKVRDKLRLYAHAYSTSAADITRYAIAKAAEGFSAIGHVNPFLDEPESEPYFLTHAGLIKLGIDTVRSVRQGIGEEIDLLLELHRRLTPSEAIVFSQAAAQYLPMWIEDPVRPENLDAMAEVARKSPIPVATGERFHSVQQFKMAIERRALSFARVSIGICGGITGALKVAALAEANDIQLAPHNPISPIGLAACAAIGFARPCVAIQEYPTGLDGFVFKTTPDLLGANIVRWKMRVEKGFLIPSDAPGLGIELRDDAELIRPPITKKVSMRHHVDGCVVDQ
jgi:galactonate dehydratase